MFDFSKIVWASMNGRVQSYRYIRYLILYLLKRPWYRNRCITSLLNFTFEMELSRLSFLDGFSFFDTKSFNLIFVFYWWLNNVLSFQISYWQILHQCSQFLGKNVNRCVAKIIGWLLIGSWLMKLTIKPPTKSKRRLKLQLRLAIIMKV